MGSDYEELSNFDPDKKLRSNQNIMMLTLMYSFIIAFIFAIFIALFITFFFGYQNVIKLILADPIKQKEFAIKLFKIYIQYIQYAWSYKMKLGIKSYNHFLPKIILCTLGPFITIGMLAYYFRHFIASFRPVKKKQSLHGDAHWATEPEIRKAKLRCKQGLLLGNTKKGYLVNEGYQHVLLFAPTGSGKGVGFIIPNLLWWNQSIVCHDIKGENFQLGSKWRYKHLGQKVFFWEPANQDGITHAYNPIDWISEKPGLMVDDVGKISNLLLPKQDFWNSEARTLLVGIMLWMIADPTRVKSFGEVVRMIRSDDFAYAIATALDVLGEKIHPIGYMNLASFAQMADKTASGVKSTLNAALELWGNPVIDASTAKSDFNFQVLKKELTSIFIGLTPDNIQRLKPLMTIVYQQATEFLSRKMPGKDEPYGVLFLMDEFPTVGKLEQFLSGIAYFRGYRVRLFLVVQDTQQLKGTYEDSGMNSFLSNSTFRITFSANNVETAKLISELVGNRTVESYSYTKKAFLDFSHASAGKNTSAAQRALISASEVITLDRSKQIVLVESFNPILCDKIIYYADKVFTSRLWGQTEVPTQEIVVHKANITKKKDDGGNNDNLLLEE